MDLSSLIFVALFVAWAVYLVPKALRHHEEDASSRSVEGFSNRLRVLARREAVSATEAELVAPGRPSRNRERERAVEESRPVQRNSSIGDEQTAAPTPAPRAARPSDVRLRLRRAAAARQAAARRRRVFNLLLLAIVVVAAMAIGKVLAWTWLAAPVGLMAAWLVACRLMVKKERATRGAASRSRPAPAEYDVERYADRLGSDEMRDDTDEIPVVPAAATADAAADDAADESSVGRWAPVSVPLPTYVAKEPAGRTVRTIDLDSTGVWSSGRNEADSQLAREADAQRAEGDAGADGEQRATGS